MASGSYSSGSRMRSGAITYGHRGRASARAATRGEAMTKRMDAAFDGLRAAIFEMYATMEENDSRDGAEHQRRAHALEGIDEILEWRPLASFSARHLELLELLFANSSLEEGRKG